MDDSANMFDQVIDSDADVNTNDQAKSNDQKRNTVPINFYAKKHPVKCKFSIFYFLFYLITIY